MRFGLVTGLFLVRLADLATGESTLVNASGTEHDALLYRMATSYTRRRGRRCAWSSRSAGSRETGCSSETSEWTHRASNGASGATSDRRTAVGQGGEPIPAEVMLARVKVSAESGGSRGVVRPRALTTPTSGSPRRAWRLR
jgi:hypothetical protein